MRQIVACHCVQCRKSSGHFSAATSVNPSKLTMVRDQSLRWFRSSDTAQRGFCGECGSSLFWKPDSGDRVSIYAGSIDSDHDAKLTAHIYLDYQGDYYDVECSHDVGLFTQTGAHLNAPHE